MTKRKVFYSFHYAGDAWRTGQVRNIGVVEGNAPISDNAWETIKKGGDIAIRTWINDQLQRRSCTIVLVGADTANRKWINYEIIKSWTSNMGVAGIYIDGLKDAHLYTPNKGSNPFDCITYGDKKLSSLVKCYNPIGRNSKSKYDWIKNNLSNIIEEAIEIRKSK